MSYQPHIARRYVTVLWAVTIIVGSIATFIVLSKMKEPPRENTTQSGPVAVKVRTVQNTVQNAGIAINGRLNSKSKFEVFTEVNGKLVSTSKPFKDGVSFTKGEVLLKLDDSDARLSIMANRSAFLSLLTSLLPDLKLDHSVNFESWKSYVGSFDPSKEIGDLPATKSDTEKNFLVSKNVFNQFYAIRSAEAQLRKFTVYAPFDGVVSDANVNPNTILRAGQRVGIFIDPINFEMEAGVSVSNASKVKVGNKVALKSNDIEGKWNGLVTRKSESVDSKTQNIKVYLDVSGNSLYEGVYLSGMINGQEMDSCTTIPRYLLIGNSDVYVYKDSKLALVHVDVIHESHDELIVRGIPNGTQIIDQVVPGAYEGMTIEIAQ